MKHCIHAVESCPTSAEHIHCSNPHPSPSAIPKVFFRHFNRVGRHLSKRDPDFAQWIGEKNNLSIDRSRCKSICKFPPPFYWPSLTPAPFPFLPSSPPPVLIPSFLPAPPFISHLSLKLPQDRVWAGEERYDWRQTDLWTGLNNYHASLCAPTKE